MGNSKTTLSHTHIRASRSADKKSHTHNYRNKNPRASDNLEHSVNIRTNDVKPWNNRFDKQSAIRWRVIFVDEQKETQTNKKMKNN